jgi:hypothetical protein
MCPELVPEHFAKAGSETLAIIFMGSWVLTLVFNYEFVHDNPLKDRMGYNNLCVGFDSSPARYFAMPLFVLKAYLDIRYVLAAMQRSDLEKRTGILKSTWRYQFSICVNGLYACYLPFLPFLVFVEPTGNDSVLFHYSIFAVIIVFRLLLITSNFCQRSDIGDIQLESWIWYGCFVLTTVFSLILSFLDFLFYNAKKGGTQTPFIPWYILMSLDYFWFLLVLITSRYLPDSSTIVVSYKLVLKGAPCNDDGFLDDDGVFNIGVRGAKKHDINDMNTGITSEVVVAVGRNDEMRRNDVARLGRDVETGDSMPHLSTQDTSVGAPQHCEIVLNRIEIESENCSVAPARAGNNCKKITSKVAPTPTIFSCDTAC